MQYSLRGQPAHQTAWGSPTGPERRPWIALAVTIGGGGVTAWLLYVILKRPSREGSRTVHHSLSAVSRRREGRGSRRAASRCRRSASARWASTSRADPSPDPAPLARETTRDADGVL